MIGAALKPWHLRAMHGGVPPLMALWSSESDLSDTPLPMTLAMAAESLLVWKTLQCKQGRSHRSHRSHGTVVVLWQHAQITIRTVHGPFGNLRMLLTISAPVSQKLYRRRNRIARYGCGQHCKPLSDHRPIYRCGLFGANRGPRKFGGRPGCDLTMAGTDHARYTVILPHHKLIYV